MPRIPAVLCTGWITRRFQVGSDPHSDGRSEDEALWRRRRPKAGVAPDSATTPPAATARSEAIAKTTRREGHNKHSRRRQGRDLARKQLASLLSVTKRSFPLRDRAEHRRLDSAARRRLTEPLGVFALINTSRVKQQVKYEVKVGCVPLFTFLHGLDPTFVQPGAMST